jgi:hypothetical protein
MKLNRFVLVLVFFFMTAAGVQAEEAMDAFPHLTVRGEAELLVPADQAEMRISVVSTADSVKDALRQNSQKAKEVERAFVRAGLSEKEYETGRFQIQPVWAQRPLKSAGDWEPRISAYMVTNAFTVKTEKLELVGTIIESAIEAGGNSVDSVSFTLADPGIYRKNAVEEAVAKARNDAQALAQASGVRLGKILVINLDNSANGISPLRIFGISQEMKGAPPPLKPGEVTVRASVGITYEIQ